VIAGGLPPIEEVEPAAVLEAKSHTERSRAGLSTHAGADDLVGDVEVREGDRRIAGRGLGQLSVAQIQLPGGIGFGGDVVSDELGIGQIETAGGVERCDPGALPEVFLDLKSFGGVERPVIDDPFHQVAGEPERGVDVLAQDDIGGIGRIGATHGGAGLDHSAAIDGEAVSVGSAFAEHLGKDPETGAGTVMMRDVMLVSASMSLTVSRTVKLPGLVEGTLSIGGRV
jgi:hypothetical protein